VRTVEASRQLSSSIGLFPAALRLRHCPVILSRFFVPCCCRHSMEVFAHSSYRYSELASNSAVPGALMVHDLCVCMCAHAHSGTSYRDCGPCF
jgi:hypothetical protein